MELKRFKKYFILSIAILLLIGFTFFRKPQDPPRAKPDAERTLTEEQEIKTLATQFAMQYSTYTAGDFSNLEKLLPLMSEEMQTREKARITQLQQSWEVGPRTYRTVETDFIGSTLSRQADDRAQVMIINTQRLYDGAFVEDASQPQGRKLVDVNGESSISALVLKNTTTDNNYQVELVKGAGGWKIDKVEVVPYQELIIETPPEDLSNDDLIIE